MPMDLQTFDRVFTHYPNTPDQEEDLAEVYRQAKRFAQAVRERVDPKYHDQVLAQVAGALSVCRTAIEMSPRQMKPLVLV